MLEERAKFICDTARLLRVYYECIDEAMGLDEEGKPGVDWEFLDTLRREPIIDYTSQLLSALHQLRKEGEGE